MSERSRYRQNETGHAERDRQTDAVFDAFLAGISSIEELSDTEIELMRRLLPNNFEQGEFEEITRNRIALAMGSKSIDCSAE